MRTALRLRNVLAAGLPRETGAEVGVSRRGEATPLCLGPSPARGCAQVSAGGTGNVTGIKLVRCEIVCFDLAGPAEVFQARQRVHGKKTKCTSACRRIAVQ